MIDGDVNASAIQLPRFGAFGPLRNYLTIGMPLLLCLTPDEFRFIVAHEFGHFSGKHGKFGAWIYRLNRTWANLQENVGSHTGSWVLSSFFNWFEPRFAATTFVLRREQEYEADKVAMGLTNPKAGADALMRLYYIEPHLQKHFWEPIGARVKTDPTPPTDVLIQMSVVAGGSVGSEFIKERLALAFKSQTDYDDTHPSLTDRLKAMGVDGGESLDRYSTFLSEELSETAAGRFLGQYQQPVLERVSGELARNLTENWTQAHKDYQEGVRRLEQLEAMMQEKPLTEEESLEYGHLVAEVRTPQEAIPLFQAHLERYPNDASAIFLLGSALLDTGDESGIPLLRQVMNMKPELGVHAISRIGEFEHTRGNLNALEVLEEEMEMAQATMALVSYEARDFNLTDEFLPHELSQDALQKLVDEIAKQKDVLQAFLVRKRLPSTPDLPRLCLIVIRRKHNLETEDAPQKFVEKLADEIQHTDGLMLYSPPKPKPWVQRLSAIPGALVFEQR